MRKKERVGKFTNHEKLHKFKSMENYKDKLIIFSFKYLLYGLFCLGAVTSLLAVLIENQINFLYIFLFIYLAPPLYCFLLYKIISLLQKKVLLKGLDLLITDIPLDIIDEIKGIYEAIGYDCEHLKIVDSECNCIKAYKNN